MAIPDAAAMLILIAMMEEVKQVGQMEEFFQVIFCDVELPF